MNKIKRHVLFLLTILLVSSLSGCRTDPPLTRYDAQFLQLFDTMTSVVGYAGTKTEFTSFAQKLHDELEDYHKLYDIYHEYEGINNIKTINDQAGVAPVKVDKKIIGLLEFAIEMGEKTDGYVNVSMGSVLSIWHSYRSEGIDDPKRSSLPPMEELKEAAEHMDIRMVEIDKEASTVYLADPEMSLDVGAIAKGYAVEQVCRQMEEEGFERALVSVGGNVRAIGTRADGTRWKVGIQDPNSRNQSEYLHTVSLEDQSLVTSGSYQRYYTVDGVRYHHIINPDKLMPWNEYDSVSILCEDSGMADALSTAVFNIPLEEGKALIDGMDGVEALWIYPDGKEVYSAGFQAYMEDAS